MNLDKTTAEAIAREYAPKETSKIVALKKLDRKAKRPARVFSITFGIVSMLLMGTGMCLSMKVIGGGAAIMVALGVIVGLIGIAGMCVNYPIYQRLLKKGKDKYAFEIIELAKEISGEDGNY